MPTAAAPAAMRAARTQTSENPAPTNARTKQGKSAARTTNLALVSGARTGCTVTSTACLPLTWRPAATLQYDYTTAPSRAGLADWHICDSSIEVTGEGPTKLNISLSQPRGVAIGRPFQLEYQIDNLGEEPANNVRIEAAVDDGLTIVSAPTTTVDAIETEFWGKVELVLSQEVGTVSLVVTSESDRAVVSAQISERHTRPWWYGVPLSGVLLILGGGLLAFYVIAPPARRRFFSARRHRETDNQN